MTSRGDYAPSDRPPATGTSLIVAATVLLAVPVAVAACGAVHALGLAAVVAYILLTVPEPEGRTRGAAPAPPNEALKLPGYAGMLRRAPRRRPASASAHAHGPSA